MNGHQQVRLHNQAKVRFSRPGARRGPFVWFLIVLIVSVMIAWFGFLGWGLIEFLRSLIGFAEYLWSIV
jgi:hypothetical protein